MDGNFCWEESFPNIRDIRAIRGENILKMSTSLILQEPWSHLRRHTQARIALGRSGGSLPTREWLSFARDHALARDAVWETFDSAALAAELRTFGTEVLKLNSAAPDRAVYLQRPDLGRKLDAASAALLDQHPTGQGRDLVIVVSDGLSAQAATRQTQPLLQALLPRLKEAGFTLAPICVVRHARVALQDEVGERLKAQLALILLGERPGLATPDSLGAYFIYEPAVGKSNALRNCVSNIRPEGLPPEPAAIKLVSLLTAARDKQLTGVGLKEEDESPVLLHGRPGQSSLPI
jgi:ethanolamine ammonia-lyase small subunit